MDYEKKKKKQYPKCTGGKLKWDLNENGWIVFDWKEYRNVLRDKIGLPATELLVYMGMADFTGSSIKMTLDEKANFKIKSGNWSGCFKIYRKMEHIMEYGACEIWQARDAIDTLIKRGLLIRLKRGGGRPTKRTGHSSGTCYLVVPLFVSENFLAAKEMARPKVKPEPEPKELEEEEEEEEEESEEERWEREEKDREKVREAEKRWKGLAAERLKKLKESQ